MSDMSAQNLQSSAVVDELQLHMDRQFALCNALENIADTLPQNVDTQKCLGLAIALLPLVQAAHRFEEEIIFDRLRDIQADDAFLSGVFERLHSEHFEDEAFGEEVSESLRELAHGETANFEKIGYMLRGFFEGLRRHVAYEKDVLLPMLAADARTLQ